MPRLLVTVLLLSSSVAAALRLKLNQPLDTLRNADAEDSLENFLLLSSNRPTKLSFRYCESCDDSSVRVKAIMERPGSTCSFPVFGWEEATHHIKLWSIGKQLEIFQVIKIFEEPSNNSMDLFVVNMNSCQYSKTEILRGYDYFQAGGAFIVFEPLNSEYFEIFSLDGDKECGSRVCKRVYDLKKRNVSSPIGFPLLDDQFKDWQLSFMAASSDKGYFAIIRSKDSMIKLLSINSSGELINSSDDSIESKVRFLKMSTYHGAFGFCYILDDKLNEVHCMQLDDNLNVLANVSHEVAYEPSFLAVHNLPESAGLLVLTARCDTVDCRRHEMHITRLDCNASSPFARFSDDDGCVPRNQQQFNFYEDDDKICVFYACDLSVEDGNVQKTTRFRCF